MTRNQNKRSNRRLTKFRPVGLVLTFVILVLLFTMFPITPSSHAVVHDQDPPGTFPRDPRAEVQPIPDPGDDPPVDPGPDPGDDPPVDPEPDPGDDDDDDDDCGDDSDDGSSKILPITNDPVYVASGRKKISNVDLSIKLTTGVFNVSRSFVSDPSYLSPPVTGRKWNLSIFEFLKHDAGTGDITLSGRPRGKTRFTASGPNWVKAGPGRQFMRQDGSDFVLVTPGRRERVFYGDGDFKDLIKEDRNLRTGEVHTYCWILPWQPGSPYEDIPRLDKIFLNGTNSANAEATLDFKIGLGEGGMLSQVEVLRDFGAGLVAVERVEYTYRLDGQGMHPIHIDVGPTTPNNNNPLNGMGTLAMILHRDFTPSLAERVRITQFRYHGPGQTQAMQWQGEDAQLKMVIRPEQIEAAYDEFTRLCNPNLSITAFARDLYGLADGDLICPQSGIRVIDLASNIIEKYEDPQQQGGENARVKVQHLRPGCGCTGQTTRLTYDYFEYNPPGENQQFTTRITESFHDGMVWIPRKLKYYDTEVLSTVTNPAPFLRTRAIVEPDATGEPLVGGRRFVWHYAYDSSNRLRKVLTPSALSSYTPGDAATPPAYVASQQDGLVRVYDYDANNRRTKRQIHQGDVSLGQDNDDACLTCILIIETTFGDADGLGLEWNSTNSRDDLVSLRKKYRKDPAAPGFDPDDDVEVTKRFYGFHPDASVAWSESQVEAELETENGPGGTYSSYELYDTDGRNVWSVAADGAITARSFATNLPAFVDSVTQNAPNSIPDPYAGLVTTGFGRDADGGSLTTTFAYDDLGRVTTVTSPSGISTYILRRMDFLPDDVAEDGVRFLAEVSLPHIINGFPGNPPAITAGPAVVTWRTAGGQILATSTYALWDFIDYDQNLNPYYIWRFSSLFFKELTRTRWFVDLEGTVDERWEWDRLPAGPDPENYHVTNFEYDTLGRLEFTVNPNGTVTQNVYDDLTDRVVENLAGISVNDVFTDMVTISRSFYDHVEESGSPQQGVGNGNFTLVQQFIDSNPANARETEFTYDFRDRQIVTKNPMPPHDVVAYDNLDRVVQRAAYSSATPPTDPGIATDRVHYEETNYGQRGLVYRQAVATDPPAPPSFLEGHTWYDEVGRTISTWNPTSVTTKTTFDGLGRSVVTYQTDRGGDAAPGAAGNYADVYDLGTHKANVTGDVVFQQAETHYILPGDYPLDAYAGLVDLTTARRRTHDATDTDTGDLADFSGPAAKLRIDTYAGIYYDEADRPIRSVNYGTNKNGFEYGGLAPTINQSTPPDWDTTGPEIVVETTYNLRGLVGMTTAFGKEASPNDEPLRTKIYYDDMNRQRAVIENQDDVEDDMFGVDNDIEWNATTERWEVTDGLDPNEPDKDRVTTFVYDGLGNVIKQVAHLPGEFAGGEGSVQVTQYIYGVTLAGDSGRSSNDLLGQITYPDLETTTFTYNRPAERSGMTDQNGTAHEFLRDDLGRTILDRITTFGTNIDQTVKATGSKYDNAGLTTFVTSYNVDNPNLVTPQPSEIVNEVEFTYTPLDEIQEIWQEPFGMVDRDGQGGDDSLRVSYSYSTSPFIGGSNHSRVLKLTYPDGRELTHLYGTASSSDDRISRIRSLGINSASPFALPPDTVKYDYIGLGMIAVADYSVPDVQIDHTAAHDGKRQWNGYNDNPGVYSGLDRFGRNVRHMWVDGDFTVHLLPGQSVGNWPPIVELASSYDKASSRLTSYDERPGVQQPLSHQYAHDGLQRLVDAPRGSWINQVFTAGLYTQEWDLDMLGNSDEVRTELDGTPGYTGAGEKDVRSHNASVNELDGRDTDTPAGDEFTYTYDDAGNVQRMDFVQTTTALVFTHDAWNRLVRVQFEDSQQQILHDRAEYEYNGLNWRVIKRADSDLTDGNNVLDQQRIMYYSASWQLLEERIDDDGPTFPDSPTSTDIDRHMQYAWGIRYIDDIYLHREDTDKNGSYDKTYYHLTDPQFSTVALIDRSAVVAERVTYTAYGQGRHHWLFDVDGDGDVEIDDILAIANLLGTPIANSAYRSECDINRNGTIDNDDLTGNTLEAALAFGLISDSSSGGVDNQIGYDGYVFNTETQEYLARNRYYEPELGRWLRRDPAGYIDGMNQYEYVLSNPITRSDMLGLFANAKQGKKTKCCGKTIGINFHTYLPNKDQYGVTRGGSEFREADRIFQACFATCIPTCPNGKPKHEVIVGPVTHIRASTYGRVKTGKQEDDVFGLRYNIKVEFGLGQRSLRTGKPILSKTIGWKVMINENQLRPQARSGGATSVNQLLGVILAHEGGLHAISNYSTHPPGTGFADSAAPNVRAGTIFSPQGCKSLCKKLDIDS